MDIKAELDKALKGFTETLDAQKKEIATHGESSQKTADALDEIGKQVEGLQTKMTGVESMYDKLTAKKNRGGFGGADEAKSAGQHVIADESFAQFAEVKGKASHEIAVPSFHQKSILTTAADSGGALIDPFRDPQLIVPNERILRLRDLMQVSPLSSGALEYAEEVGYANLYTELDASAAIAATTFTVDNINGILPNVAVEVGNAGNVETVMVTAVQNDPDLPNYKQVTIAAPGFVNAHNATDPFVASVFGCTPETRIKPRAKIDYELKTLAPCTIAHWLPISRQLLADAPAMQGTIDGRLTYGLKLSEEHQILYGAGGGNLTGILTNANINNYAWASGPTTDTKLDAIRRGMTLSRLAEYPTTGSVINPLDWEDIELAKGSDNHYIWTTAPGSGAQMQVWRVPVVETTAIQAGTILTGGFGLGAKLWDREEATVRVSEHHEDFFVKNMVAILAEERLLQTVYRPEAFTAIDVTTAPS
jgi:hypothetical protein